MLQTHLVDAVGVYHIPVTAPARIVCLVPSITELLFELGLGEHVVGRTSYCIYPVGQIQAVPSVGGTKKIKHEVLKALHATHVIVNIDENPKTMVEQIATYVPHVIVTHPLGPLDNLSLYRLLGAIFAREAEAEGLCQRFARSLAALRAETRHWPRRKVLYFIWRKPWMTVARDTYISHTLRLVGWETVPATATQRYPVVEINLALLAEADIILFSTEPYHFQPNDLEDFTRTYDCTSDKLLLVDGEMTSWYGSRAILGFDYLRRFADIHGQPYLSVGAGRDHPL